MRDRDIARARLANQCLAGNAQQTPEEVVSRLCAVQSQEYAVAKWSIGQRCVSSSDDALERAIANGNVLRAHVLRPTWHFVLPSDIRWMVELTRPRIQTLNASYYRKFGLDDRVFAKSQPLMVSALAGGEHLTRTELAALLRGAGIVAEGPKLAYLLMRAELDLVICSGAPKGKQQTYALFEQRVPKARALERDEALGELTRRYFTGHGPATLKDYRGWSSLTAAETKRGVGRAGATLEHATVGDLSYWFATSQTDRLEASPSIHLLQGYDEYVIAYSDSRHIYNLGGYAGVTVPGKALFTHAVVLDGQVIGHWRRVPRAASMLLEMCLAKALRRPEKQALAAAAERLGKFCGVPVELSIHP
jgi:hypothetical protein